MCGNISHDGLYHDDRVVECMLRTITVHSLSGVDVRGQYDGRAVYSISIVYIVFIGASLQHVFLLLC